ncbi:MAG: PfkB family carbohydrate kinase [Chitinophagaceae bacterium]
MLRFDKAVEIIPGIAANVIDTTGAGDAFVGAVLSQLNKKSGSEIKYTTGTEWKKIILNANKIAAATCEHFGAMEAYNYLNGRIIS